MLTAGISRYLFLIASILFAGLSCASGQPDWVSMGPDGDRRVHIYVFWSQRCPHCQAALPFLEQLRADEPWLEVEDFEITRSRANRQRFATMAAALDEEARSVPAFFVCGRMLTGFDDADGIGAEVLSLARTCRHAAASNPGEEAQPASGRGEGTLHLPVIGGIDLEALSLPVFTLVIAGLDAFNPCAFFVLLFLLSLMVHARNRARMLQIGVTFVFFSGLVYFLFMATWLNLFLVLGVAPAVTAVAGCVAVLFGIVNIKDFFLFKRGATLSIPGQAMPGLFSRMRNLVSADRLGIILAGTVVLALAANSYELLCTAGFPMVFTRILTLNELPRSAYYGYLVLYNLVYVLPLLAIVLAFTLTLGARKLTERQGRVLKLLSGLMMLGLGAVLLVAPDRLSSLWTGVVLLSGALAVTAVAARLTRSPSASRSGP